jgi:hypothetical protein
MSIRPVKKLITARAEPEAIRKEVRSVTTMGTRAKGDRWHSMEVVQFQ